jgi:hypothetical protein
MATEYGKKWWKKNLDEMGFSHLGDWEEGFKQHNFRRF